MKTQSRRRASPARKPASISLVIEDRRWQQDAALLRLIRRASRLALAAENASPCKGEVGARQRGGWGSKSAPPFLTVLLADDARLRALNISFRGKAKPANVLSFPSRPSDAPYLGDVALAYGVVKREARAQSKSFAAHAVHLVVHGILHLTGHDHEKTKDARAMEGLETGILAKLGIADPYAPRPCTGPGKAA